MNDFYLLIRLLFQNFLKSFILKLLSSLRILNQCRTLIYFLEQLLFNFMLRHSSKTDSIIIQILTLIVVVIYGGIAELSILLLRVLVWIMCVIYREILILCELMALQRYRGLCLRMVTRVIDWLRPIKTCILWLLSFCKSLIYIYYFMKEQIQW